MSMPEIAFPTPAGFPVSGTSIDPRFGANPYTAPGSPVANINPYQGAQVAAAAAGFAANPDDLAAIEKQTTVALAKIAAINPALAEQLLQQRTGEGDGGLWGFFKDVVGSTIGGGLSLGGKLLELLGRTSHIVPQWFDPTDQGNFVQDIGQAMSGEDKTNWNEVFQNSGWTGGGVSGFFRATLGLGMDILTDPLTWATAGAGAGLSVSEKALTAARIATTKGASAKAVAKAAEFASLEVDDAGGLLMKAWNLFSGETDNMAAIKRLVDGGAEEVALMATLTKDARVLRALQDAFETGATVYNMAYARTLKSFLGKGGTLTLKSGTEIAGTELRAMYETIAQGANFTKYGDNAWKAAKAAAGALGGIRFRYAVPFMKFRYISPMVPQSWRLGFGWLGRFGAGLSANKVISSEIIAGRLPTEAMTLLATRGWSGIETLAREGGELAPLARNIIDLTRGSRMPWVRSAFWSASEQTGKFTKYLSPGAKVYRMGLGYYFERNGISGAKTMRQHLTNDLFYAVKTTESGAAQRSDLYRRVYQYWGPKSKKTEEQFLLGSKFMDYFAGGGIPFSDAEIRSGAFDDWFWNSTPVRAATKRRHDEALTVPGYGIIGDGEYSKMAAVLDDMKETLRQVTGEDRRILEDIGSTEAFGRTQAERRGMHVGEARIDWDSTGVIHPDDIKAFQGVMPPHLAVTHYMEVPDGSTVSGTRFSGITSEHAVAQEEGVIGVRVTADATNVAAGRRVPVTTNIHNTMDVNLEDLEAGIARESLDGSESYADILATVRKAMDDDGAELGRRLHPLMDNPIIRTTWADSIEADLVTTILKRRVDAPDAVRFFRNGEPVSTVILDTRRVKTLTESSPIQLVRGGYYRRTLTESFRAFLGGEGRLGERRIFGSPGELSLRFRRETRDMTLDEAEAHVRETLRAGGFELPDNMLIFERDILKAHENYVSYIGNNLFAFQTGKITQRMLELGNLSPGHFGAIAKTARVKFQMPASRLAALVRADRAVQDAALKLQSRMDKVAAAEASARLGEHDRIALALAYLELGLEGGDIPAQQLASALDNVVETAARLGRTVSEEGQRLTARRAVLAEEEQLTNRVLEELRVSEVEEAYHRIDEITTDVAGVDELSATRADQWRAKLEAQKQAIPPTATEIEPGIWKLDNPRPAVKAAYLVTDWKGDVVHARVVTGERGLLAAGSVTAQTLAGETHNGYGFRAILAHWRDEGVTDIVGIRRMLEPNTLTPAAAGLNKKAARAIIGVDPDNIKDLLTRGELYIGKNETIYTKTGLIRRAGKRLYSIDDLHHEMRLIDQHMAELDDVRRGLKAPVTEEAEISAGVLALNKLELEPYEVMLERRALGGVQDTAKELTIRQRQAAAAFEGAGIRLSKAEQATLRRSEREALKRGGVIARTRARLTQVYTEYQRAQAEAAGAWAEMRPAVTFGAPPAGGKTMFREVQIPGLGGVFAHPYVAEEMEFLFRGRTPGYLGKLWRQHLLGPWKRWATYRNPGFHVRNWFGAWFNNKLGGVDELDEQFSFRVNMARADKGEWYNRPITAEEWKRLGFEYHAGLSQLRGKLTYGQISEMLADMGIGRANTTAVALTMGGEGLTMKSRNAAGTFFANLDRKLRNVGGTTEDFHRIAAWSAGMRHTGGDLYGARGFVMVRHGDYSDLTEAEEYIRDLIPFYKWMRTNVPYQFRMLAENPGLMTAIADKGQTFVYAAQGLDRYDSERNMPQWMREVYRIPVPKGIPFIGEKTMMLDLPFADLYNGLRDYLSSGLPYIRNVAESYGIQQSIYTGAPLGEKMVPLSGIWNIPGIRDVLRALPWAQEGADGGVFIPDTLENVLGAVPIYARYRNFMLADPNRVEHRTSALFSALLGFSLREEDATAAEQAFYWEELVPTIQRLKSMGYEFPTAEELEAMGTAIVGYGSDPGADELFPGGVGPTLAPMGG